MSTSISHPRPPYPQSPIFLLQGPWPGQAHEFMLTLTLSQSSLYPKWMTSAHIQSPDLRGFCSPLSLKVTDSLVQSSSWPLSPHSNTLEWPIWEPPLSADLTAPHVAIDVHWERGAGGFCGGTHTSCTTPIWWWMAAGLRTWWSRHRSSGCIVTCYTWSAVLSLQDLVACGSFILRGYSSLLQRACPCSRT